MKNVIGIGNALTDVLINLHSDKILNDFGLPKGSMSLMDASVQRKISERTADLPHTLSLGGSAANTIRAMSKLKVQVGFIGKVGYDTTGDFFEKALENLWIDPVIMRGTQHSGRCVSLISKDGERTMATYLGAALEMCQQEITSDIFRGYDCLYVEGYLVQDHSLIEKAVKTARECGLKVALDLASFNIVEENLEFLHRLVSDYVDILFANECEARSFTGEDDPRAAIDVIAPMCEIAIVKIGTRGAYIKRNGDEVIHVGIMAAAERVDTTGAGDFYAAGFLAGMCRGLSMRQCGTLGAIAAGKVIEVVGTTFDDDTWEEIHRLTDNVVEETYLF